MIGFKKFCCFSAVLLLAQGAFAARDTNAKKAGKVVENRAGSPSAPHALLAELPESLKACIRNALKNNKEIKSAKSDLIASHEDFNIARAEFLPKLSASGILNASESQIGGSRNSTTKEDLQQRIFGAEYRSEANIGVTQNIFRGGADVGKLNEVEKSIQAKAKSFENTVQSVIRGICETYFEVITKAEQMELLKAWLASGKENIRVATGMLAAGTAKDVDLAQARAGFAETEARMSKVEAEYKSALAKLEELTCAPVASKLTSSKAIIKTKLQLGAAMKLAERFSPYLLEAEAKLQAAQAALKKPNSELAPSLDLSTKYGANKMRRLGNTSIGDSQISFGPSVELALSFPIFSGGRGVSQKRQYAELVTKASVDKQHIYNRIKTEVVSTLERLEAAEETIVSAHVAIEARELALRSTQEEYRAGAKIMNDVLEAERKVFEAKTTLAEAVQERLKQQCILLSLIGCLTPEFIGMKSLMFDHKAAFEKQKRTALFYRRNSRSI